MKTPPFEDFNPGFHFRLSLFRSPNVISTRSPSSLRSNESSKSNCPSLHRNLCSLGERKNATRTRTVREKRLRASTGDGAVSRRSGDGTRGSTERAYALRSPLTGPLLPCLTRSMRGTAASRRVHRGQRLITRREGESGRERGIR